MAREMPWPRWLGRTPVISLNAQPSEGRNDVAAMPIHTPSMIARTTPRGS
jgi:hypothetical protein